MSELKEDYGYMTNKYNVVSWMRYGTEKDIS